MKYLSIVICFFSSIQFVFGQASYVPRSTDTYRIMNRFDIKGMSDYDFHTSIRYYSRKEIASFIFDLESKNLSSRDNKNYRYLQNDNLEYFKDDLAPSVERISSKSYVDSVFYSLEGKEVERSQIKYRKDSGLFKHFYKSPAKFFEINSGSFQLTINPILNIRFGQDRKNEDLLFLNSRGIQLHGLIDNKVYFYTDIVESQGSFKRHIDRRIFKHQAIPGHGNYKSFQSSVADDINGYDFPLSTAYVGLNVTKNIGVEFGHGKHFIGDGYNSLLLDDYGNNYFYLKFRTKIWKFLYQNLFAELAPISAVQNSGDNLLPKKYMASHYLSYKPFKSFEIGLFESVLFSRENNFEFQYLNPVILYRTVEFSLDSPDNVLVGLNAKWNLFNRFSLYGQVVLDEFKLNEIRERSGWWANKYGFQMGLKYVDILGVDQLDGQVEYNYVRPYTYTHRDTFDGYNTSVANYSHFNLPMAHPLGANFKEMIFILNYSIGKMNFSGRAMIAEYGDDDIQNWGGNILLPHNSHVNDFGNFVGQGINTKVLQFALDANYELYHNIYLDLELLYRKSDSEDNLKDINTEFFGMGIRANISNLKLDY